MEPDVGPRTASGTAVEDVWKALRSSAGAKDTDFFDRMWRCLQNDAVRSPAAVKPLATLVSPHPPGSYSLSTAPELPKPAPETHQMRSGACTGPCTAQRPGLSLPLDDSQIERVAQQLLDTDVRQRRAALEQLQSALAAAGALEDGDAAATEVPSATPADKPQLQLPTSLVKPLLRRFDDSSEKCREMAVGCVHALLRGAGGDGALGLLPYAIPTLEERLQRKPRGPVEQSEEVRLQLVRLLTLTINQVGLAACAYAGETLAMLEAALADAYHEVNLEGCACVRALVASLGMRLQPAAKQLVAVVLPLTTHKRHRVRIAALQALGPLVHQGAHEMVLEMVGHRDPNLVPVTAFYGDPDLRINFCGKLAADANPQVRLEFLRVVADWMLHLPERFDHEGRLLPYILAALVDDAPAVSSEAALALEALGAQYEAEHEAEVRELEAYCPDEITNRCCLAASGDCAPEALTASSGGEGPAARLMGGAPPRLGVRLLVQGNAGRLLMPLCAELSSWQELPRGRSAALLELVLDLVGPKAEGYLQLLVPALVKAIRSPNTCDAIASCCALLSRHCRLSQLLALLAPRAQDAGADARSRADALLCTAHVVRGTASESSSGSSFGGGAAASSTFLSSSRDGSAVQRTGSSSGITAALPALLELLEDPELCQSEDTSITNSWLRLAAAVVTACPPAELAGAAPRLVAALLLQCASAADEEGDGVMPLSATTATTAGGCKGSGASSAGLEGWCGDDGRTRRAQEAEAVLWQLAETVEGVENTCSSNEEGCPDESAAAGAGNVVERFLTNHRAQVLWCLEELQQVGLRSQLCAAAIGVLTSAPAAVRKRFDHRFDSAR